MRPEKKGIFLEHISLHSKFTNEIAVCAKLLVLKYLRVCLMRKHAVTSETQNASRPSRPQHALQIRDKIQALS